MIHFSQCNLLFKATLENDEKPKGVVCLPTPN